MVHSKGISQEMMYMIIVLIIIILFLAMVLIYVTGKAEELTEGLVNMIKVVIKR